MRVICLLLLLAGCAKHVPLSPPLDTIQTRKDYSFRELQRGVYAVMVQGERRLGKLQQAERDFGCKPCTLEKAPVDVYIVIKR